MISPSNGFHTRFKFRLIGFVIVVSILCTAYGQNSAVSGLSLETGEHVKRPGWWPTKGTAALSEYAGSAACARCHRSISASQAQTPMFNAASRPAEASVLRQHDNLQFSEGDYGYKLTRVGNQTVFLVENTWDSICAGCVGDRKWRSRSNLPPQEKRYLFRKPTQLFSRLIWP